MINSKILNFKGSLEVTTKVGCYNMCEYCPQLLLINKYKDINFFSVDVDNKPNINLKYRVSTMTLLT